MKPGVVETLAMEIRKADRRAICHALIEFCCDDDDLLDEDKVEEFLGFLSRAVENEKARKKAES